MPVITIFISYILLTMLLIKNKVSFRNSIIFAYTILSLIVIVITESLGAFNLLDFKGVLISWLVVVLSLFIAYIKVYHVKYTDIINFKKIQEHIKIFKTSIIKLDRTSKVLLIVILCIILTLGTVVCYAYPNNYDAMTYHMPRVMHWLQNNNLNHFATHILRQIYCNPYAEYLILNLIVLGESDKFANLAQYISMIFSLIGITSITKYLGGTAKTQLYSALIALTVPMGLIQATSAQNDYVVTFYTVSFVLSCLILIKNNLTKYENIFYLTICGISLGIGILTKGTTYFFLFPFCVVLAIYCLYRYKFKSLLALLIIITIPIAINGPHMLRNYNTFNNFIAPADHIEDYYSVKHFSVSGFISSTLRNTGLHIQIPNKYIQNNLQNGIYKIHKWMNYDINNPNTTIGGHYNYPLFQLRCIEINDHYTGNTLELILIFISLCMFLKPSFRKENKSFFIYSLLIISAFLLFCLFVKWQPFGTRLHLGLFILYSPTIAALIAYIEKLKMNVLLYLTLSLIIINALPYIILSQYRPLIGPDNIFTTTRYKQYYLNMRYLLKYQLCGFDTLFYLKKTNIGLILWKDEYEYPIWAKLKDRKEKFNIEHVKVNNDSSKYETPNVDIILDYSKL